MVISKVPVRHPRVLSSLNKFQAKIHGDRDVFVQEGSDVNLTCTALSTPEPPDRVVWRHNNLDLHLSTRGGIAIVTEKRRRVSNLMISRYMQFNTISGVLFYFYL